MPSQKRRKDSSKSLSESDIQSIIQAQIGGLKEVTIPRAGIGRVDNLTATRLIELKRVEDWKAGIGQLQVYSLFYPQHQKTLYLFGKSSTISRKDVIDACRENGIEVFYLTFTANIHPLYTTEISSTQHQNAKELVISSSDIQGNHIASLEEEETCELW
jgi:hypothetical protein